MKRNLTLHAAVALALSACPLFAQENQPAPPPPPADGKAAPSHGDRPPGGERHLHGIFAQLDANHDGAIDAAELAHAVDVLRALDRNGDGRITPDEMHAAGGPQREASGDGHSRREGRPGGEDRADRGPRDQPAPLRGGPREPGRGPAPDEARPEGGRPPAVRAEMPSRRDRFAQGRREDGRGPRMNDERGPQSDRPMPPPRDGYARHDGPPHSPENAGPQPPPRGPGGDRFAQREMRPDFGAPNSRAPWQQGFRRDDFGPRGPLAFAPQQRELPAMHRGPGGDRFGRPELRNDPGSRGPQRPPEDFRPQGRDLDRPAGPRGEHAGPPPPQRNDGGERGSFGHPDRAPNGPGEMNQPRPQRPERDFQ